MLSVAGEGGTSGDGGQLIQGFYAKLTTLDFIPHAVGRKPSNRRWARHGLLPHPCGKSGYLWVFYVVSIERAVGWQTEAAEDAAQWPCGQRSHTDCAAMAPPSLWPWEALLSLFRPLFAHLLSEVINVRCHSSSEDWVNASVTPFCFSSPLWQISEGKLFKGPKFILAPSFRRFGPWSFSSIALGLKSEQSEHHDWRHGAKQWWTCE